MCISADLKCNCGGAEKLKADALRYGTSEMSFTAVLHRPRVIMSDLQAESDLAQSWLPHIAALPKS